MGQSIVQVAEKLQAIWRPLAPGTHLKSKAHYAAELRANPRTVYKALDALTKLGVIYWLQDGAYLNCKIALGIEVSADASRREQDIEEFRLLFECAVAGLAAEHYASAPVAARNALDTAMRALRLAYAGRNLDHDIECDFNFHIAIYGLVRNPIVRATMATARGPLEVKIRQNLTRFDSHSGFRRATFEQHERLYQAVITGDRLGAMQAMTAQVDYVAGLLHKLRISEALA